MSADTISPLVSTGRNLLDIAEARAATPDGRAVAVLALQGELDVATAPALRERITELVSEGLVLVVADLRGIGFLGATGLGVLAGGASRLRRRDGDLVLVRPERGPIARIMHLTGIDRALTNCTSSRDALAALGSPPC